MLEIGEAVAAQPVRRRLPDERKAIVHHFKVGGYEGYLTRIRKLNEVFRLLVRA